ncbi:MAG TPA: hypothetical protein VI382_06305 [Candidatus Manganitrophaceae bacterium]|nr:hypothetical protein [Candidatus Manganitrophaceae bacterium]
MKSKPQKNIPVIFIAENASGRLETLRNLVRRLYFLSPFESVFKEFVLAFSTRRDTIWIWLVLRSATEETLEAIRKETEEARIGWVGLQGQTEEEKERHRETVVKFQESYQVFSAEDIDALLALFKERIALNGASQR